MVMEDSKNLLVLSIGSVSFHMEYQFFKTGFKDIWKYCFNDMPVYGTTTRLY